MMGEGAPVRMVVGELALRTFAEAHQRACAGVRRGARRTLAQSDAAGPGEASLLYSLAVKVFEFPPSRRLVRVCRGKFVRSSEPSGDFALTGRSPRVSLLLDKLLSPKSLLSDSHPSVSKPSSPLQLYRCSVSYYELYSYSC